jgi:cytochrome c biogenesis factor
MLTGLLSGRSPLPDLGQLVHGRNPFEDLYVVLQGFDSSNANHHNANRRVVLQVIVNPMVGLIWLGGLLTGLGGFAALASARRRRTATVAAPEPVRLQPEEVHV